MAIRVRCTCGQVLRARDELAGRRVRCPQCGTASVLPAPAAVAPRREAPVPAAPPRPPEVLLPDGCVEELAPPPEEATGLADLPARYRIDLGAWFRAANEHYAAVLGPMIGYLLLFLLIVVGLVLLSLVVIGYLGVFLLLPHLAAGPTIVCLLQLKGRRWGFGDFFAGFRRYGTWLALELLLDLLLAACLVPGLVLTLVLATVGQSFDEHGPNAASSVLALFILGIWLASAGVMIYVLFRAGVFARQQVIDRRCGAIEAIKGSWRLTGGHFWGLFGAFLLVLLGVEAVSLLTCGIGMLFALPYGLLVLNAGYLQITGTRRPVAASGSPES